MSATDIVPVNGGDLEQDPVQYMAVVLNRAKSWLAEAQSIDSVRETKAIAVGYESVIREKELAFDAQLSATEIVRRCERRIGELVREGQRNGTISARIDNARGHRDGLVSPYEAAGVPENSRSALAREIYPMADASSEEFDQALVDAREEGNLSRANVVRKVKGEPTPERTRRTHTVNLETVHGKQVAAAHARRFTDLTHALAGYAAGIESLDIALIGAAMEPDELTEWTRSLRDSLRKLNRFRSDLQEVRN